LEYEIKRFSLWPLFRNTFLVSGILFLILFIFMGNFIMQMMNQSMADMGMGPTGVSGPLSFFTILSLAVSNAFFFSLFLTAAGAIYNFITHWTGGIKMELDYPYEEYDDGYEDDEEQVDDADFLSDENGETDKE
jgi:hypothetical protein